MQITPIPLLNMPKPWKTAWLISPTTQKSALTLYFPFHQLWHSRNKNNMNALGQSSRKQRMQNVIVWFQILVKSSSIIRKMRYSKTLIIELSDILTGLLQVRDSGLWGSGLWGSGLWESGLWGSGLWGSGLWDFGQLWHMHARPNEI